MQLQHGIEGIDNSTTTVLLVGGTIGESVYGAANTDQVFGNAIVRIGTDAVNDNTLTKGNISIGETVFGGGKSDEAGSESYNFTFESVTGDAEVTIDANGYDNGSSSDFYIGSSIFGSGNAAKINGNGYVTIRNYGTVNNPKRNLSIQRATTVTVENSNIWLLSQTDTINETSLTYTLNRIVELIIKDNTTLYLAANSNLLEKITSVDESNNKATVTINNGTVTKNTDNRIYLLQGKNLILRDEAGNHGEVNGMTFVGLYKGTFNMETGIYDSTYNEGDSVLSTEEVFNRNSYVQGKHYNNHINQPPDWHDITVDGFYTNYDIDGIITVNYIDPIPDSEIYYQWVVGEASEDIYYEDIELIATKYSTTGSHVLLLTGLNRPNTIINVLDIDTSDLLDGVNLVDDSTIPNINLNGTENTQFGLSMTTGNSGWQTTGTTDFITGATTSDSSWTGSTTFVKDNSTTTPEISFYMGHSKNVSAKQNLGTVTIHLEAGYVDEKDEYIIRDVYIILILSVDNSNSVVIDYYEGAITPGAEYDMFPTTMTNITSKSTLSAYYSLFMSDYSKDATHFENYEGYYHALTSSMVYPANTKITMIDTSTTTPRYYYYIVSETDVANGKFVYPLTDFIAMGSTNEHYNSDSSYYMKDLDLVFEEFIFQVDFKDSTIPSNLVQQRLTLKLLQLGDNTEAITVNTDQYPMLYSIYTDKDAIKTVKINADKNVIYIGDTVNLEIEITYSYQFAEGVTVYDTNHFEDALGLRLSIWDGSAQLLGDEISGISYTCNNLNYYPRTDGATRIKAADTVSNVKMNITLNTLNSVWQTGGYIIRAESFGSIDGTYFSSALAEDTTNIQVISTGYGLSAEILDTSQIVDKVTGNHLGADNKLNFTIGYSSEFTNPQICVALYRRKYDTVTTTEYELVNLQDYVTENLTSATNTNEYIVTSSPQELQTFELTLKNNLTTGTYKVLFKLYDGTNYIGEIYKQIIIK